MMNCEVEFLAVGESSKAGDCIIVRYGEENAYSLMVVDGGMESTGQVLVDHLRKHFGQQRIAHVVLTHSDNDHASGLRTLLKEFYVDNVWLHVPWIHAKDAVPLFDDKTLSPDELEELVKAEYSILNEIVELAEAQGSNIQSPFEGDTIGPFRVMSPSHIRYLYLLPQFYHSLDETPGPDRDAIEQQGMWIGKTQLSGLARMAEALYAKAERWVTESWTHERLKDDGAVTSANNESSVVLYANTGTQKVLLTGDAGVRALYWTIGYARIEGFPLQQFSFVQIPHHGSRRNVGPTVLDALLGPKQPTKSERFSAFVSSPKDDTDHPRLMVTNAFMRRGGKVLATRGQHKIFYGGFSARPGYSTVEPMEFATEVQDYT